MSEGETKVAHGLGADRVLDNRDVWTVLDGEKTGVVGEWSQEKHPGEIFYGFDLVLDCVGRAETWQHAQRVLACETT